MVLVVLYVCSKYNSFNSPRLEKSIESVEMMPSLIIHPRIGEFVQDSRIQVFTWIYYYFVLVDVIVIVVVVVVKEEKVITSSSTLNMFLS